MLRWYYTDNFGNKLELKTNASKTFVRNEHFQNFVKLFSRLPIEKRHDLKKVLGSKRQNYGRDPNLCSSGRNDADMLQREPLTKKTCIFCDIVGGQKNKTKMTN